MSVTVHRKYSCKAAHAAAPALVLSALIQLNLALPQTACALSPADLKDQLPPEDALNVLAKNKVGGQFIDSLRQAANFKDYQVECQLFTKKGDGWKTFGAAMLCYKQKDQIRATIKSNDYRDGSIVVKQADGSVRGRGGGMLRALTMNLEPDSRSIRLPTGYSLASSDFLSLYDALKGALGRGAAASATGSAVTLKLFREPVLVLIVDKSGPGTQSGKASDVVFVNPSSKLPLAWATYKDGQPSALVIFDGLMQNKGLSDDLFHL